MVEDVSDPEFLDPHLVRELCGHVIPEPVDRRDFPHLVRRVEFRYRQSLAVVIAEREAEDVVTVAVDPRQQDAVIPVQHSQRMNGGGVTNDKPDWFTVFGNAASLLPRPQDIERVTGR